MILKPRDLPITLGLIGLLTLKGMAGAIVPKQNEGSLDSLAFVSERLQVNTEIESIDDVRKIAGASVISAWDSFRVDHGEWTAVIDKRTGALEIAEGQGIPFIPGHGNQLRVADISAHLGGKRAVDLATLESITRAFLPRVVSLLGVDPKMLKLNAGRSGHPAEHLWNIDFDIERDGVAIDGARVVFRVNNGNLIQFGSENLPSAGTPTPKAKLGRKDALAALSAYIGGFSAADTFVDGGSLHLLTVHVEDARFAEGYAPGKGRGLAIVWQLIFRRAGDNATWRGRVDARTGEVLELRDINDYAQVTGGTKVLGTSTDLPMPFADWSSGRYTNSAGVYNYPGSTVTSTLSGQFVKISDTCGPISLAANAAGDIAFGTSGGTDCTTPGFGGRGNSHSSRSQFYHVNRAKEIARGWLPGNKWLNAQLTTNVNMAGPCSAFWDTLTINFYRSRPGICSNIGEIETASLHEYGHGLDSNDGNGDSPDQGTGETYADFTAALATHTSCIGAGFRTSDCSSYGDSCTSCTGVRDIDFAKHTSGVAHTVSNFTQRCPPSSRYQGPCGKEGHCESYISSEALWDFVNRDLPSRGSGAAWTTADRLWYLSRSTATAAFDCNPSGTWTSDGCNTGSLWNTMRAVDDDDGNLANGTPHSAALFAAFNRHGIACTIDAGASTSFRGCTQPAVPSITLIPGNNSVYVGISGSTGVYDVYRNERGCYNAGFIKVANDNAITAFNDTAVANGSTYYYQVTAEPRGNESCASAPSTCLSVTPAADMKDAKFISQNIPLTMDARRKYPASVTLKNVGTGTWIPIAGAVPGCYDYRLGSTNPSSMARVELPAPVPPGGEVTLNFTITAPSTPGTYLYEWRMLQECVSWFGDFTPGKDVTVQAAPQRDAQILASSSIPATTGAGRKYPVSITLRNVGTETWIPGGPNSYHLGRYYTGSTERVELPAPVPPGGEVTLNFTITAPSPSSPSPKTEEYQWRMLKEAVDWFGDSTTKVAVKVQPVLPKDAQILAYNVPGVMFIGQDYSVSVTLRNVGTETWIPSDTNPNPYRLGRYYTGSTERVELPARVPPDGEVTLNFTITAPSSPGTYEYQWMMLQEKINWFGDSTPKIVVSVEPRPR
jgi:hypothetical protein